MRWRELSPLWVAVLAAALLAEPNAAQTAEPLRLSPEQARDYARDLISANQPAAARAVALGLLQADPDDFSALITLARAEAALDHLPAARRAARAAWHATKIPNDRFVAAALRAQILARSDQLTFAQYWLRRAGELAPNTAARDLVARDYAALRAANPLQVSVGADFSPSSNVNNGSANATTTFEGLPFVFELSPEAQALSGGTATLSANLRYALARTDRNVTFLTLDVMSRWAWLSAAAKIAAPEAEALNYRYFVVGIGLSHRWQPVPGGEPINLSIRADQAWYGGDPYSTGQSLTLSRDFTRGETDRFGLTATLARTLYLRDGQTAYPTTLALSWAHAMPTGDVVSSGVSISSSSSEIETRRYHGTSINLGYDFGEVLGTFDLSTRLTQEWRGYESKFTGSDLRRDSRISATLSAGATHWDLFGFQPVVTIEMSHNQSNVDLYETMTVNTGLSFRTSF